MVTVRVPATIANLGPAFDALGLAVTLYNTVEFARAAAPSVEVHGEGEGQLPVDAQNLVYRAAAAVAVRQGQPTPFEVRCRNAIPLGRGLGSSAAAIVAGVVGANTLLGGPLDEDDLVNLAAEMEGHPDNVAPALLGGAVVCSTAGGRRFGFARLTPAWDVAVVVAVPSFSVSTVEARALLPREVPFSDAAANVSRAATLVASLVTGRTDLLAQAMEDSLHQPYRRRLVPGLDEVSAAARAAGAYGAALAGSGPSIVALAPTDRAAVVGTAMVQAFHEAGKPARALLLSIDKTGAALI